MAFNAKCHDESGKIGLLGRQAEQVFLKVIGNRDTRLRVCGLVSLLGGV